MKNARQTAFEVLYKIHANKSYSNLVLDTYLNELPFDSRDRAFVSTLVYGVTERMLTIDYNLALYLKQPLKKLKPEVLILLRMGVYQLLFMDKVPDSAAINESVKLTKANKCAFASGLVNAVLRNAAKNGLALPPEQDESYLSIRYSCPQWLIDMWIKAYGAEDTKDLLNSSVGKVPIYIRVNTLKTAPDALIDALSREGITAEKCGLLENTLVLHQQGGIERSKAYHDGLFHVQDLSSQLCCAALEAEAGETVFDVCAAPGGKSFTIAEQMDNRGKIKSFDIFESRLNLVRQGCERLGIEIVETDVSDASVYDGSRGLADRILCDVPCSGLGIIRRKPEIRYKSQENIDKLHNLQYLILCTTARYLKPGGRLIYSTCSLNPRENTDVVYRFIKENRNFRVVPVYDDTYGMVQDGMLTLLPGRHQTDGFFIAVLEKAQS